VRKLDEYKAIESLYVPSWLEKIIHDTNFDIADTRNIALLSEPTLAKIFRLNSAQSRMLRSDRHALVSLLQTPFSMQTITLRTIADWDCLVDGTPTTRAVDELMQNVPNDMAPLTKSSIDEANKRFMTVVTTILHLNILAAPLLGISPELATYLKSMTGHKLHSLMERAPGLPLFQFRFANSRFWEELADNSITAESIGHQLMMTSPALEDFVLPKNWGVQFRLPKNEADRYADAMMAYGCRAKKAADLLNLNTAQMRKRYLAIHGTPSTCGNQATSLPWFVETPKRRLQASFFAWLYRYALNSGVNVPQAIIATNDLYEKLFGATSLINQDRAILLIRSMSADNRLTMTGCRNCGTEYVLSNCDNRIEMQSQFVCPACLLKLDGRTRSTKKKRPQE